MKMAAKAVIAIGGIIFGAFAAEKVFLARLEYSVIHDDARLNAFLKSLNYPIWVEPSLGFCRIGGSSWGYEYQLCVYSSTAATCPMDSYLLQYLGPQSMFSILSRVYHDEELVFRIPIFNIDRLGNICRDKRGVK